MLVRTVRIVLEGHLRIKHNGDRTSDKSGYDGNDNTRVIEDPVSDVARFDLLLILEPQDRAFLSAALSLRDDISVHAVSSHDSLANTRIV